MTTVVLNTVTRKVEVFSSARDVQARAEIADHKAAADPHPQYLADLDAADIALSGDAGDLVAGTVPDARMPNWTGYNVASRTALEAANVPAAVDALRLLGYTSIGDGGGALYKRAASEPSHAAKIQSADSAWWELAESPINVLQFGAKASGSNDDAATNTTAFDNCIAYLIAKGGGTLLVPAGTYYKGPTDIRSTSNIHIRGAGRGATKIVLKDSPSANQGSVFNFGATSAEVTNCSISGMEIDGNRVNQQLSTTPGDSNEGLTVATADGFVISDLYVHETDGYGIGLIGTSLTPRQDIIVQDCEIEASNADCLDIKGGGQRIFLENLRVHGTLPNLRGGGSLGIDIRGRYINITNCWVWDIDDTLAHAGIRVRVDNSVSSIQSEINIADCFVLDCPVGFTINGGSTSWVNMSNCWALQCDEYGLKQTESHLFLSNCHFDGSGINGVRIESGAQQFIMLGGSARNNAQDGITRAAGGAHVELHGVEATANTRHGINAAGAGQLKIFGGTVSENGSLGIKIDGVSDEWVLAGATVTGNASADIQYGGTIAAGSLLAVEYGTVSGTVPSGTIEVGTSTVRFGAHNAIEAETVTGYIEITDAGGTVRKVAVVS